MSMTIGLLVATGILLIFEIPLITLIVLQAIPGIPMELVLPAQMITNKLVTFAITLLISMFWYKVFEWTSYCCFFSSEKSVLRVIKHVKVKFLWLLSGLDTILLFLLSPFIGSFYILKSALKILFVLFVLSFFNVYQSKAPPPLTLSDSIYEAYVATVGCSVMARIDWEKRQNEYKTVSLAEMDATTVTVDMHDDDDDDVNYKTRPQQQQNIELEENV
jgi:hypothetical protein